MQQDFQLCTVCTSFPPTSQRFCLPGIVATDQRQRRRLRPRRCRAAELCRVLVVRICAEHAVPRAFSCLAFSAHTSVLKCHGGEALPVSLLQQRISHTPFSVRLWWWYLVLVWCGGRSGVCPEVHVTLEPEASEEMSAGRPGTFMVALAWQCVCVCACSLRRAVVCEMIRSLLTGPAKQKNPADDTSQTAQRNDCGR